MSNKVKLQNLINTAKELMRNNVTENDGLLFAWRENVARVLTKIYGKDSLEYDSFQKITFNVTWGYAISNADKSKIKACAMGLEKSIELLHSYIEEIEDCNMTTNDFTKIFIVHGHDGEIKESVARLIEKQGIEAVILSEKTNRGKTIIEKLEKHSNVGGAICLFTSDDLGKEKNESRNKPRARQNVVFEAGYFMGKLGRDHVVIIADEKVDMPSDLRGILYTNKTDWKHDVLAELEEIGYLIDYSKE